jgi:basic membrane protein A and related proteins
MSTVFFKKKVTTSKGFYLKCGTRVLLILLTAVILIATSGSCTKSGQVDPIKKSILNIGLILGSAGLGDKSFNDSAYQGLIEAQKELNIRFETVTFSGTQSDIDTLRQFAQKNYDLIIGIAFENMINIQTVAKEFPQVKFAAIDFEAPGDNTCSVVYREQEADFLMGALASMITKTGKVGVIGGMDIPAIRRIISGFKQGVAYQDNSVTVFTLIAGTFSDPQVGYNQAMGLYNDGIDLIHNAASKTGLGIIQAAQGVKKYTTGTSGDQRYLAPGYMIGNRPKQVSTAVKILIEEVNKGTFKTGTRSLGLKENGLSLGPFDETVVTRAMLIRIDEIKQKIINGEIQVSGE